MVWISATNFLVTSFFLDEVHEYKMDGTHAGLFCSVAEPEGIVVIPPPFNLIVVTSMVSGDMKFFSIDDGCKSAGTCSQAYTELSCPF